MRGCWRLCQAGPIGKLGSGQSEFGTPVVNHLAEQQRCSRLLVDGGVFVGAGALPANVTAAGIVTRRSIQCAVGRTEWVIVATGYGTRRQLRWRETDVADAAQRLFVAIREAEQDPRRQLLGRHDRMIETGAQFRPALSHNSQYAGRPLRIGRDDSSHR